MIKPIKTIAVALAAIASMSVQQTEACTRATYIGPDNTVITGRTMDWKEDIMSNSKWINGGFFNHGKYNDRTQRR